MAETTTIAWADATFNPWEGCTKVSPGCDRCYAEARNRRFSAGANWGPGAPRRRTTAANWRKPLAWDRAAAASGKPFRVFCASLADVFDNEVPDEWRSDLWALINATPHLTWMLLTKRIGNVVTVPGNVWLGITVVNQEEANRDIPKLLAVPRVGVRWLSCEPLLGPITFRWAPWQSLSRERPTDHLDGLRALNWVIVGGESGPGARSMDLAWARSMRDQCAAARLPFFMKQLGAYPIDDSRPSGFTIGDGERGRPIHMTKNAAGAEPNEWPEDLRVRQFPV